VDELTKKLAISVRHDEVVHVLAVVSSGLDRDILKLLRDDTAYLVMIVRARNEERKAEYAEAAEIATVVSINADPQERLF